MNKSNLLTQIATLNADFKLPKGYEAELLGLIELLNVKTPKNDHPAIIEDGVITQVWCLKHERYEPVAEFPLSKKGRDGYHNKCIFADLQWRKFLKDIKATELAMRNAIDSGDFEAAAEHNKSLKNLEILNKSSYTIREELSADEIAAILPKEKEEV